LREPVERRPPFDDESDWQINIDEKINPKLAMFFCNRSEPSCCLGDFACKHWDLP